MAHELGYCLFGGSEHIPVPGPSACVRHAVLSRDAGDLPYPPRITPNRAQMAGNMRVVAAFNRGKRLSGRLSPTKETDMSTPENLQDIYAEELADNWSANDQMQKAVTEMARVAGDDKLKQRLQKAAEGIQKHTQTIKQLLSDLGENKPEHCKGMEGLVTEAHKHAIDADISDNDVRDVVIITQYQRMCHYGLAGLGSAKAFAEALGKQDHAGKLDEIVGQIYDADQNMTDLAERSVNLRAKESQPA